MIVNGSSRRMCIVRWLAGILSTLHPPAFEQGDFPFFTDLGMVYNLISFTGMSPSGKASGFGPDIRGFESLHPNQSLFCCPII